jgi:redox-sensitive bicupin YhaK (pirin superfamily)
MITLHPTIPHAHSDSERLDMEHTFAAGDRHDPTRIAFRSLSFINEERMQPGAGFERRERRDIEIITYILEGTLEHNDDFNNGSVIFRGDVHRMTAGRGVAREVGNHSENEPLHFLEIGIEPEERGITPGYEQRNYFEEEMRGRLLLVASRDGRDASVTIHRDADLYLSILEAGEEVAHRLRPGRGAWLRVARGRVTLNGVELAAGDGAAVEDEEMMVTCAIEAAEILLLDMG